MEKYKKKTKLAFQAVSHCNVESGRNDLTIKLRELMPLDVVGRCHGIAKCPDQCYMTEIVKLISSKYNKT